ncbi:LacI family DNA-binding transcriptional regulator [Maledivibacter halophilus]|uniref:Transcriptional regulator, LacI family n=1 Tax=Maledivibacter halophilus TaxID=36842 RepID=A0A1T5J6Y0_9FIRM|nr:LacI family DNA-binding transcriptional regulator [Maledivibacter halophilus]SKC47018.1 transcriptional regulator, LacI family [Maledivibacter halophilus]
MGKVTIKDVAKRAGVCVATVSRVLNNNYPVKEKTKNKVLEAIQELQYQPNDIARSLKNNKTNTIGVIVADISNAYFMQIAKGIENVIQEKGYNLIISSTDENPLKEIEILDMLSQKRVDAIIISSCNNDGTFIERLIKRGLPVVLIDRRIKGLTADIIVEDNYVAAYDLVSQLIAKGHKRISIVNGSNFVSSGQERFEGYKKALEDNCLKIRNEYIFQGEFRKEVAYTKIKKMLETMDKDELPTAIFAANNLMAEGVMAALFEKNINIPEDISLVSFGELSTPELIKPRLTVVSQKAFSIGQKAGELAIQRIDEDGNLNRKNYKEIVMVSDIYNGESVKTLNDV